MEVVAVAAAVVEVHNQLPPSFHLFICKGKSNNRWGNMEKIVNWGGVNG